MGTTEEYALEDVRKCKCEDGKFYLFMKWKGFPESANTWEPEEHLGEVGKALRKKVENLKKKVLDERANDTAKKAEPRAKRSSMTNDNSKQAEPRAGRSSDNTSREINEEDSGESRGQIISIGRHGHSVAVVLRDAQSNKKKITIEEARRDFAQPLLDYLLARLKFPS